MPRKYVPLLILFVLVVIRLLIFYRDPASIGLSKLPAKPPYALKLNAIVTRMTARTQNSLPKIPADLLLGMTVGVDSIKEDTEFYQALITTGLVHVVVVSGYNVSLVISFINGLFKQKFRARNKIILLLSLSLYVILCGAQAPVIRAAIMGYIAYLAQTEGRGLNGVLLLATVCLLMLFVQPLYLLSLSFWLSTLATFGLMLYQAAVKELILAFFKPMQRLIKIFPVDDLCNSIACQITVWPLISYFFGRVSLLSPLYNMFVLWLIPLCTILGFIYLFLDAVSGYLAYLFSFLLLPFYDIFVRIVAFFAYIDRGSLSLKINLWFFVAYYIFILVLGFALKYKNTRVVEVLSKA